MQRRDSVDSRILDVNMSLEWLANLAYSKWRRSTDAAGELTSNLRAAYLVRATFLSSCANAIDKFGNSWAESLSQSSVGISE